MEEKEKELLLKDLSARLPYKMQCYCKWAKDVPNGTIGCVQELSTFLIDEIEVMGNSDYESQICEVKPYLRPMSSMTDEEKKELLQISNFNPDIDDICYDSICFIERTLIDITDIANFINWLNAHHFDYRGLIPKGLALEASEGMYKND